MNDRVKKEKEKAIVIVLATVALTLLPLIGTIVLYIYNEVNSPIQTAKPIIYLYPEEETEVTVSLGYPEKITTSYPKYENGWNVTAKPDGTLDTKEGFVVKGEDSARFLEEKLEILGLNERESEEFIVYWLPKLEANKYNFIRFETMDKINEDMPLEINPKPDTLIRAWMEFKGLDKYKKVQEQQLQTQERKGFVAVEWGGVELK